MGNMFASPNSSISTFRNSPHSTMLSGSCLFSSCVGVLGACVGFLGLVWFDLRFCFPPGAGFLGHFLCCFLACKHSNSIVASGPIDMSCDVFSGKGVLACTSLSSPPLPSRAFSVRAQALFLALFFFLSPLFCSLVARSTSCSGCHAYCFCVFLPFLLLKGQNSILIKHRKFKNWIPLPVLDLMYQIR